MTHVHSHITPSHARRFAGTAALLLLAACSAGAPGDASPDAVADSGSAAATTTAPAEVDLCKLMPIADVSAILQANGVDPVNKAEPGAGGMCAYRRELQPRGYSTKMLIDFTRFASVDKAREQMQVMRDEYARRGVDTPAMPGLGDDAMSTANEGASNVYIRMGAVAGHVTLRMGEREPATLQPAALALGQEVVKRFPAP